MKTNRRIVWKTLASLFFVITVMASCQKGEDAVVDEPIKDKTPGQFKVIFPATTTISFNLVDSGYVVFQKENSQDTVHKKFEKGTDLLHFSLDRLTAGNWNASMFIFTHNPNQGSIEGRRYGQSKLITIAADPQAAIELNGPNGKISNDWKPSLMQHDAANGLTLIVPLDFSDPAFEFRLTDTRWEHINLQKIAYKRNGGTNPWVAGGDWECQGDCAGLGKIFGNKTTFIPFTQSLATKTWDNGEIFVTMENNATQSDVTIYFLFEKD